tara:strand:+ start:8834 stop:9286 length:453 start_codon:yes stop_codon:yes gene_type:complete
MLNVVQNITAHYRQAILILLASLLFSVGAYADTKTQIEQNIAPLAKSHLSGKKIQARVVKKLSLKEQLALGKKIYVRRCSFCHASGSAGAPKVKDTADWQLRDKKGMKLLLEHVTKGYNMMPPKGTCMSCDQQELQSAILYMMQLSGVKH